jgi:protein NrfD
VTSVFALFLLRAALGLLGSLALVPEKAGDRFFKLCSASAAFVLVAALGLLAEKGGPSLPRSFSGALLACALAAVLYNRAWHFGWRRLRPLVLGVALVAGLAAFWAVSPSEGRALALATDVTSAWLLGAAASAMILGHYYLVVLDLPTAALRRLTVLLIFGLLARGGVLLYALLGPGRLGLDEALFVASGLFSADGVFVWMRVLFGILGPASLLWFIWKTVEIRSTQSATGILYVQLFLVLSGELLSTYLRVVAGLPL